MVDFPEQFRQGGKAIGNCVGIGQGIQMRQFINAGNFKLAQSRSVTDLTDTYMGPIPQADGLAFFAGANQLDKMLFQQQHISRITADHRGGKEPIYQSSGLSQACLKVSTDSSISAGPAVERIFNCGDAVRVPSTPNECGRRAFIAASRCSGLISSR